jgi:LPS-assembly lipoprotein
MSKRLFLTITIAVTLLTACGFHLRGKLPLAESLQVIYVKSPNVLMRDAMADALAGTGATVVDDPEATKAAVLDLYDVSYERLVRTIDTRGKVTGYTLQYQVSFTMTSAEGEELRQAGPMVIRRDIDFDPDQVLQKEDEEFSLRRDMEREMSQRILRQLSTIVKWGLPQSPRVAAVAATGTQRI